MAKPEALVQIIGFIQKTTGIEAIKKDASYIREAIFPEYYLALLGRASLYVLYPAICKGAETVSLTDGSLRGIGIGLADTVSTAVVGGLILNGLYFEAGAFKAGYNTLVELPDAFRSIRRILPSRS